MEILKFGSNNIEEMICDFETSVGMSLPDDVLAFLRKYNGGETPNTSFNLDTISSDVKGFYGFGDVKYSVDKNSVFEYDEKTLFPIAFDSFGNDIVVDLNTGEVYFKDHEGKIVKLSDNLADFVGECKSQPLGDNVKKTVEQREQELIEKGRGDIITDELREMWRAEIAKYDNFRFETVSI